MNKIFKVIYSKVRNCYVVTSEFAKANTKSSTGSAKSKTGRKALLTLAVASAIMCGGWMNVGAAVQSETISASGTTSNPVLTVDNTDDAAQLNKVISAAKDDKLLTKDNLSGQLTDYAKSSDVTEVKDAAKTLSDKIDNSDTGLNSKASTSLDNLTETGSDKIKELAKVSVSSDLAGKTNQDMDNLSETGSNKIKELAKAAVDLTDYAKTETVNESLQNKADKSLENIDADGEAKIKSVMKDSLDAKANASDVTAIAGRVTTIETTLGNEITNGLIKDVNDLQSSVASKASQDDVNKLKETVGDDNKGLVKDVNDLKETVGDSTKGLVKGVADNETDIGKLNEKTSQISFDNGSNSTKINGMDVGANQVDMASKNLTNVGTINGTTIGEKVTNGTYVKQDKSLWGNLGELDTQTKTNTEKIDELDKNSVKYDSDTKDKISLKGTDGTTITNLKDATLSDTSKDAVTGKQLKATNTKLIEEATTRENEDTKLSNRIGTVANNGKYIQASNDTNTIAKNLEYLDMALASTDQRTSKITRDDTKNETTIEGKVTIDNNGNVKAEGTITSTGVDAGNGEIKTTGKVSTGTLETTDKATIGGDLEVKGNLNVREISMKNTAADSHGNNHDSSTTITADGISNTAKITDRDGKITESKFTHDEKGSTTYAHEGNSTDGKEATSNVTANGVENIAKDSKGNNNTFTQTSTETKNTLKDAAGNISSTRQDAKGNYGYAKDKDGNKSYTKQEGNRIAESVIGKDGKETKSEMTTTDITNTAKSGTIKNEAKDIVNSASGNIKNSSATMDTTVTGKATESYGELETTIKGNETHNVDGNQTSTIKGTQSTTVEGDVTEDYKKNLTTTVGGNELHEVNGKVTENFKGGQETNVTGDQTTTVSGTQTTNATDINRNASSGMIDKVGNAYGTNTETKVAGKTTTEVTIKGTGEKGEYIRGANEAKDTLTKGTLKNSETKTVEATSTEITDGSGNTSSTIQDKGQISGSVTNGTDKAVSNVKADSIDSAVIGAGSSSVINQKKDSITSSVGNGTTSTVIQQGEKDITIASNGGTVAISGKDIINNASGNMTNIVGGDLTTTVTGKTVEDYKGGLTTTVTGDESHTVTGNQTNEVGGNQTNTIKGNQTTTVTGDISNSAKNITNEASEKLMDKVGTNTRVLDNDGITDTVGNTSFKQRIDDIMMEAKNGTKQNLTQSDADGTNHSVVNGNKSSVTKQTSEEITGAVTDGTSTNVTQNTATSSNNTIASNGKANSVISTVNGTEFVNSDAAAPVTGASGAGTADRTTIKGNTITTGKVTMDYAEVMRDLGVRGNANITGKTTTGSLEVKGESKFTGDVTMESNATVKKDLTVDGTTTTKDLNVTQNATVGGTLDVTGKATFKDSVAVAKDLSVGGNATITGDVTANSYKVGNNTYIDANGINANNQKVTNVADGTIAEGSKDAVNGGQLFETNRRIDQFDSRINEVGANAAAMANLHPMEFDADSKLNVAVGVGNYRNKTATAMGLFYRPNEDVMFNVSSTIGSNDNMVGGGISFRLGSGGNKEKTKALAQAAEQNKQLKSQVDTLQAQMDALLSVINPNMSKDFPDVPNNHWAYEAVSRLAGNDIIQGYEDGKYHGERTMTRYEMAVIIYKALQKGAKAEAKLVEEFKPELKAIAAHEKA